MNDLLQEGVAAAKSGDTGLARTLFLQVAEQDTANDMVWVCLAAVEAQLPARFQHLRRAIQINPANSTALRMLETARRQLREVLIQQAAAVLESGNHEDAEYLLLAASELDPSDTSALAKLQEFLRMETPEAAIEETGSPDTAPQPDPELVKTPQATVEEAASPETAPQPDPEFAEPSAISGGDDKFILVAEGSAAIRKLIAGALEKEGYKVLTAADGVEALERFQDHRVDLALLDVALTAMDGFQVCRTIRTTNKDVPIVMLCSKDGLVDKVRGKVAGSTAYITKPFLREELIATVQPLCPLNHQQETFQS